MKRLLLILFLIFAIAGCSGSDGNAIAPELSGSVVIPGYEVPADNHHLWGYYQLVIDDTHTSVDVKPVRTSNFHLNAHKYLELTPCTNCLEVGTIEHVGDGVIELDVTIHHPYNQNLAFSAFDVKGIIMFDASYISTLGQITYYNNPELYPGMLNWSRRGDWELLEPDGYTWYWCPQYNPDSQWDITHYMEGKYTLGEPTSNMNGYMNFYTEEERHLFRPGHEVTRTYRIQTQPGPMVVGYAIDACWAEPLVETVVDPLTDFPPEANQAEPYNLEVVVNDGEPIHQCTCCVESSGKIKIYIDQWGGLQATTIYAKMYYEEENYLYEHGSTQDYLGIANNEEIIECETGCGDNCHCGIEICFTPGAEYPPEGWYRLETVVYSGTSSSGYANQALNFTEIYYDPY